MSCRKCGGEVREKRYRTCAVCRGRYVRCECGKLREFRSMRCLECHRSEAAFRERFWRKVDKSGDCWEWRGARAASGHGVVRHNGRTQGAHRVSWQFAHGEPPRGALLDHVCRNPACVRPDHLQIATPGTNAENRRGAQRNNRPSGIRGVTRKRGRWQVQVQHNYKNHHGGYFDNLREAEAAAVALRTKLHSNNLADFDTRPSVSLAEAERGA